MAFYLQIPNLSLATQVFQVPITTYNASVKKGTWGQYKEIVAARLGNFSRVKSYRYIICIQIHLSSTGGGNANAICVKNITEAIVMALFPKSSVDIVKGIQSEWDLDDNIPYEYADVCIFRV